MHFVIRNLPEDFLAIIHHFAASAKELHSVSFGLASFLVSDRCSFGGSDEYSFFVCVVTHNIA